METKIEGCPPPESWKLQERRPVQEITLPAALPVHEDVEIPDHLGGAEVPDLAAEGDGAGMDADPNEIEFPDMDEEAIRGRDEAAEIERDVRRNDAVEELHITRSDNLDYTRVGWSIVFSVQRLHSRQRWLATRREVIQAVFTLGADYAHVPMSPEIEARWRTAIYDRLQID
jgi:hypothetical protein